VTNGPLGEPAFEDLTARARIRDAALRHFGERGIGGATIRDIAKAAGVSPGLVRHHFGSKEGLRDACDSYALDQLIRIKEQVVLEGQVTDVGFMSSAHPTVLLLYRYLARSMVDGSPAAASMFDEMVDLGERWLDRQNPGLTSDSRAYAAVFVAMETGLLAMHEQLSRALGADILSPAGHLRMTRAKLDFYSRPLLSPELAAKAHEAISLLQGRQDQSGTSPAPATDVARS